MNFLTLRKDSQKILKGFFQSDFKIYRNDFSLSAIIYWMAVVAVVGLKGNFFLQILFFSVAVISGFRCVMFLHPIFHLSFRDKKKMVSIYHWLFGYWMLLPFSTYEATHRIHHQPAHSATPRDPEYLPFAEMPRSALFQQVLKSLLIPALMLIRFTLGTWVSAFSPSTRHWLEKNASSLAIRTDFKRPPLSKSDRKRIVKDEWIGSAGFVVLSVISSGFWLKVWFLLAMAFALLNTIQLFGLHEYKGHDENALQEFDPLADTVTYETKWSWWTEVWAPVGQRYHALHHLHPSLPYHSLPQAHQSLLKNLPEGSAYHQTIRHSYFEQIRRIWKNPRKAMNENRNQRLA